MGLCLGCTALSGRYAPHLQRRNGIFHLRVRVPDELRLRIGLREVRRTLRTHSPTRASFLASIYVPRVREVFEMLRTKDFTKEHALVMLRSRFADLRRIAERGYIPSSNFPDLEIQEHAALSREHILAMEVAAATSRFPASLLVTASELCATNGWSFKDLPEDRRNDLLHGLSRALVEQQKLYLFRLRDRLLPYNMSDPLFLSAINCTSALTGEMSLAHRPSDLPSVTRLQPTSIKVAASGLARAMQDESASCGTLQSISAETAPWPISGTKVFAPTVMVSSGCGPTFTGTAQAAALCRY